MSRTFISLADAKRPLYGGIDVGGTNIKVGIVDDEGRPLSWVSIHTEEERGPEDGCRRIGEAFQRALAEAGAKLADVRRAGLGTPGMVDAQGTLLFATNLPSWSNFPLGPVAGQHCGVAVTVANDANAAAYGEYWVGSGKSFHSMALFTLGTGVGGAIIIGDLLIAGENAFGSELGHMLIDYNKTSRLCSCGLPGHLEAYASATALVVRARESLAAGSTSSLAKREPLTALAVAEEAERGDSLARELILETASFLGAGAASVMHAVDPNGIVIGGAMTFGQHETKIGRDFLARVKAEIAERTFPLLAERIVVDYASLGGDAGYIGAAGLGRLAGTKKLHG